MGGFAVQAGQDDGIEFQPFGFVDGHELQLWTGLGVGRGKQAGDFVVEALDLDLTVLGDAIEGIEVGVGVEQVGRLCEAKRAAKALPNAFYPAAGALLNAVVVGFLQYAANVQQALLSVGAELCDACVILHE